MPQPCKIFQGIRMALASHSDEKRLARFARSQNICKTATHNGNSHPGFAIVVLQNLHILYIPALPHVIFQILVCSNISTENGLVYTVQPSCQLIPTCQLVLKGRLLTKTVQAGSRSASRLLPPPCPPSLGLRRESRPNSATASVQVQLATISTRVPTTAPLPRPGH